MSGSRGSHGEAPTSRRATQADGILLATPKQQADPGDWRSRGQLEPATPSTSPSYWSDDDTEPGVKPADLYGKFTWKIENFSDISKRELRSNVFEVGNFKWYILVYPHGCDVCNHLSLFLCVADYDKLLPGWSHFAQFTIAVVNKDPKKSKYSDTLHRFCKKEHDWGWKKFMERSKVADGFTVADTLVIKAQVQVIKEAVGRPFRCLDSQYRRELVRVYLTNVEGICRRFVEEKREKLSKLVADEVRFASFRAFWAGIKESQRKGLSCEKTNTILKSVVKKFFNEKEVTSTLVMDALFSGTKSLERTYKVRAGQEEWGTPTVWLDKEHFVLSADVLTVLDRAVHEAIPAYKDDKGSGTPHRVKESGLDDLGRDAVERDERRLQELGRRTVEMFVLSHLFSTRVEVAYREAVALKRQEELIREEEEAEKQAAERVERETADKEKRQSKKQKAKQRKKDRLQKEEDERRSRLETEQRAKKEKESERRASQSSEPPPLVAVDDDSESEETSQEDADEDDDEDVSDDEEPGTLSLVDDLEEEGEDEDEDPTAEVEGDEDEAPGPATVEAEEDDDEWQEAEPAFRAVTIDAPAVTGGRSRRRRNKKKKMAESNEVVGGAGPLPVPVVGGSKPSDDASSSGSGEFAAGKGLLGSGMPGLQEVEKHNDDRSSRDVATPPDMDAPELEERVASAGAAGAPSSSGTEDYDSHESEAIIASLRERVSWLEDRLKEKEDEVVVLQEQLRQQALPNGLPSAPYPVRPSSALARTSSTASPDASRVGPANAASAQKAPVHTPLIAPNGAGVRGVVTPPQQGVNRGVTGYPRPGDPRVAGGRPSTPGDASGAARPMSAPGNPPLLRHISGPVPSIATPPPDVPSLVRSLSSVAPGGVRNPSEKAPEATHATPLAPSYRNAAAGTIRGATPAPAGQAAAASAASSAAPASSLAAFPPIGQPPQIVTQQGGSSRSSSSQPSPPMTPSSRQESPSSASTTPVKAPGAQVQSAPREQAQPGGAVPGKKGPVYAPPLHGGNSDRGANGITESGGTSKADGVSNEENGITFGSVTPDVLPPRSPRAGGPVPSSPKGQDQQAQNLGGQRPLQQAAGMTPPHPVRSNSGGQPHMDSPGLSEDFPHLSLINDLLDDDLLGMGGLIANGNPVPNQQGGFNPGVHSRIPPQLLARKLHPGASPFSPAGAANRTEAERGGGAASGNAPQANGLSHHQQKPQQSVPQQGPPQHHYQPHQGNNNAGSSGMVGGGHKNGAPEYVSAGGMQRAQQLRHARSLPPGVADGLLNNGHVGHPPMYWVPNAGAYAPPGMHVNGPMMDKNGVQGVPPGYQMAHANYGQYAPVQQPLPPQHQ